MYYSLTNRASNDFRANPESFVALLVACHPATDRVLDWIVAIDYCDVDYYSALV
jgi:hypothetical protein